MLSFDLYNSIDGHDTRWRGEMQGGGQFAISVVLDFLANKKYREKNEPEFLKYINCRILAEMVK